jgi:hypothetical protein
MRSTSMNPPADQPPLKPLPLVWQRLVKTGATCERCGCTQQQILGALARLEPALRPLGIRPELHTVALDERAFKADPLASNRIWIAGKPMEDWLGASVGFSRCCSVCGDLPCRTLQLDGSSFETIPQDLIIKAALIAAASMVEAPGAAGCCATTCGPGCR